MLHPLPLQLDHHKGAPTQAAAWMGWLREGSYKTRVRLSHSSPGLLCLLGQSLTQEPTSVTRSLLNTAQMSGFPAQQHARWTVPHSTFLKNIRQGFANDHSLSRLRGGGIEKDLWLGRFPEMRWSSPQRELSQFLQNSQTTGCKQQMN